MANVEGTQQGSGGSASKTTSTDVKLDSKTSDLLLRLYLSRRIGFQMEWYKSTIKLAEGNSDFMFRLGAMVMTLSSLMAALSTQTDSPEIKLFTALLPAFAALIASFRQLYQWDRQASLYRDTVFGLEETRLLVPDEDQWSLDVSHKIYPELVEKAENVFYEEVNQWGQIALGSEDENKTKRSYANLRKIMGWMFWMRMATSTKRNWVR